MDPFNAIAILMTITAGFVYVNHRFVRLPMSIGLMLMSLLISVFILILEIFGVSASLQADQMVTSIDFSKVLLEGMLGLLLFAGALHVNLDDLAEHKLEISIFSTLGVLTSTTDRIGALRHQLPVRLAITTDSLPSFRRVDFPHRPNRCSGNHEKRRSA